MKYGERLRTAREKVGLTQQQLAEKIHGITSQMNISKLERGDATGSQFTAQFAHACQVSALWLATGEGEMELPQLAPPQQRLLDLARQMNDAELAAFLKIGRAMAEQDEEAPSQATTPGGTDAARLDPPAPPGKTRALREIKRT